MRRVEVEVGALAGGEEYGDAQPVGYGVLAPDIRLVRTAGTQLLEGGGGWARMRWLRDAMGEPLGAERLCRVVSE